MLHPSRRFEITIFTNSQIFHWNDFNENVQLLFFRRISQPWRGLIRIGLLVRLQRRSTWFFGQSLFLFFCGEFSQFFCFHVFMFLIAAGSSHLCCEEGDHLGQPQLNSVPWCSTCYSERCFLFISCTCYHKMDITHSYLLIIGRLLRLFVLLLWPNMTNFFCHLFLTQPFLLRCICWSWWGLGQGCLCPHCSESEIFLKLSLTSVVLSKLNFQRGAAVIAARKLSSAMSAAKAASDHMKSWFGWVDWEKILLFWKNPQPIILSPSFRSTPSDDWVSMGVFSDGSYGTAEGVMFRYQAQLFPYSHKANPWMYFSFSFPVTVVNGKWSIVKVLS